MFQIHFNETYYSSWSSHKVSCLETKNSLFEGFFFDASLRFILPGCRSNTLINPCSVCYVKLVIATKKKKQCIVLICTEFVASVERAPLHKLHFPDCVTVLPYIRWYFSWKPVLVSLVSLLLKKNKKKTTASYLACLAQTICSYLLISSPEEAMYLMCVPLYFCTMCATVSRL